MNNYNPCSLLGYFNVIGRSNSKPMECFFRIDNSEDFNLILEYNNTVIKNPTEIDLRRYKPKPLIGYIKDKDKTFPNAKVTFIQKDINTSLYSEIIRETCYTDKGGKYIAFITPGVYDIEIEYANQIIRKHNIQIKDGLKFQYNIKVKGLIQNKNKDIITYCGCEYKRVLGKLVDNKNTPIDKGEIIVTQNNQLVIYTLTDEDGNYSFSLKNGEYIIKIRNNNSPMKTQKLIINDTNTFHEQITANNVMFNKEQLLVM